MPFKVVQTIEDGNFCLCVVPSGWEVKGKLYWPNRANVAKLLKDEKSLPNESWIEMNCIKKREFDKRVDAEREAERMEQQADTEQEENPIQMVQQGHRPIKQDDSLMVDPDFNMLIEHIDEEPFDTSEILTQDPKVVYVSRQNSGDDILLNEEIAEEPDQMKVVLDNQERIMKQQAKMQASLDVITEWICSGSASNSNQVLTIPQNLITAVDSLTELDALEASLKDPAQMERYLNGMKDLFGTSGKSNGMDVAYNLIDHFATRKFLTLCSWTGSSRPASDKDADNNTDNENNVKEKVGLKFYSSFRELFFRVVKFADKDFTKEACKIFFMRVTKNSKQRLNGKMGTSKHKNRPKNLKYKKPSKQNGNTGFESGKNEDVSGNEEEAEEN